MKAKKKLPLFDKLILWLNCALCLALLISYLSPITDPRKYWIIAFFGLAYPPILLFNGLMVIYWAFRKNWFALLSLGCILIGINVFKNNIGLHIGGGDRFVAGSQTAIKFMTYNVHDFKKITPPRDSSTRSEILALIRNEQPDIIGIQEFFTRHRGKYAMTDSMKKGLGYPYHYFVEVSSNIDEAIGIAIFSRIYTRILM